MNAPTIPRLTRLVRQQARLALWCRP